MTILSGSPKINPPSRSRIRCTILRKRLEPYNAFLEDRGILFEEGVDPYKLYNVIREPTERIPPGLRHAIPCTQELCYTTGAEGVLHHRRLIEAVEKGFTRVRMNLETLEEENDSLKLSLAEQVSAIGREVDPEYFRWILTILASGSLRMAAQAIGIPKTTLSRKLKRFAGRGGLYATLHALVSLRNRGLGRRRLECYRDAYQAHHPDALASLGTDVLEEVFAALEAQNEENWSRIRTEIIDLLKDCQ